MVYVIVIRSKLATVNHNKSGKRKQNTQNKVNIKCGYVKVNEHLLQEKQPKRKNHENSSVIYFLIIYQLRR